ncbi:MAG: spore cortex biosynthesis protein YabQ [Lachnospiraceae bacterium]|nr:spore cortex biosynthesis protein YabQ [Lachnospiraceae bacterium]
MSGEIVREWNFWLVSIATGACMAFAYDVLRLFRRLVRHGRFAVDLEDILYWTACFGLSFTLLYYGNNGVIRFAAVLGAAVGMAIYVGTVGRFFVKMSFWIIDKTVGSLFRVIGKGIRRMRKLLRPVKCFATKSSGKVKHQSIRIFQRIQLTHTANRHKMKENYQKDTKDGKEEAADGRKISKRKKKRKKIKKKDTRVSQDEK